MSIINNVAAVLHWDIFVMGLFSIVTIGVSLMWLFLRRKDFLIKLSVLTEKATKQDWMTTAAGALVTVMAVYYVGTMFNTFSDDWIDMKGAAHLGLKGLWAKEMGTDTAIKCEMFKVIYGLEHQNSEDIKSFYYHAKNELWKKEPWREYILYSQTMINISRVWCLAFFLTIPIAGARVLVTMIRWFNDEKDKKEATDILLSVVAVAVAMAGYSVGGFVWKSSEKEIDSKIFSVYRSLSEFVSPFHEAIMETKPYWRMTELRFPGMREASKMLEASGVAAFEEHLVIVNDRNNSLYIADTDAPSRQLTVIEAPEFPTDRVKFEDVGFHGASGYFYTIGAHFSTEKQFQQTFRFKLEKKEDQWKVTNLDKLKISDEILGELKKLPPKKASIEGIAVAGAELKPTLYVGVRIDGKFPILEFSKVGSTFKLGQVHVIVPTESTLTDTPYHLSGLAMASETDLLILAATEDGDNGFHGNRLYTVDTRDWRVKSVTPEFALAQKAEGVTLWDSKETGRRVAIVFDNDQHKTRQPSRLLIGPSHLKRLP